MNFLPRAVVSNAFGAKLVLFDPARHVHLLLHGATNHGMQSLDPARSGEPLGYMHRDGPMGDVFAALATRAAPIRAAVIGLGAGCAAAYARPGDHFVFYELDPDVVRLARDPACFTFLARCRGTHEVVVGDGLAMLAAAPAGAYDLLVMDAFDSDTTPPHLHDRGAVESFLRTLADAGLLVFHVSNVHVDLASAIADIAAILGLAGVKRADVEVTDAERAGGKLPSIFVALARAPRMLAGLAKSGRWMPLSA